MAKYIFFDGKDEALELLFTLDGKDFGGIVPISNPPVGCFRVCNLFVTAKGRLVIQFSDNPVT